MSHQGEPDVLRNLGIASKWQKMSVQSSFIGLAKMAASHRSEQISTAC